MWERKRDSPAWQAFSIVRGRRKKGKWKERGPGLAQAWPFAAGAACAPSLCPPALLQSGCSRYPHVAGTETEAGGEVATYLKPCSW